MTRIELFTTINAPAERCFDVARNVDVHLLSTAKTNEKAVAGRTTGLCELNDEITWEATHFGIRQRLKVKITKLERPFFFEDIMLKGVFKSMRHEHHFEAQGDITIMKDIFLYEVPFGIAGKLFNYLFLKRHMVKLLLERNKVLKEVAERIYKHAE